MAKPLLIELEFVDGDRVDWPVEVKLPKSVTRNGRGKPEPVFSTKTCLATFLMVADTELEELQRELREHHEKLADLRRRRVTAKDQGLPDDAEAAAEESKAVEALTRWRIALLRRVVVGFPDNHGWDAIFKTLPDFSPDLIEAMADHRQIGTAMEAAFWQMINGDKAKN